MVGVVLTFCVVGEERRNLGAMHENERSQTKRSIEVTGKGKSLD